jgi:hypothetical protein
VFSEAPYTSNQPELWTLYIHASWMWHSLVPHNPWFLMNLVRRRQIWPRSDYYAVVLPISANSVVPCTLFMGVFVRGSERSLHRLWLVPRVPDLKSANYETAFWRYAATKRKQRSGLDRNQSRGYSFQNCVWLQGPCEQVPPFTTDTCNINCFQKENGMHLT